MAASSPPDPPLLPAAKAPHVPSPGVWVPAITFFDPQTDTLDLVSQAQYFTYLAARRTGLTGLVILGSNAEALLLTRPERQALLTLARACAPPAFPLMAGCSAHSTAQVLENIHDAATSGADYALVLPCAYFGAQTAPPRVVEAFYVDIAARSPLPIVIYNFPAVCNGVDLSSESMVRIVRNPAARANVVGVKLTCGSVGKITRLAAPVADGGLAPGEFAVFGGQSDFLVGGLAAGSAGCVAAFGNVFPRSIVRVYALWMAGEVEAARRLQGKVAVAEGAVKAGGVAAVKFASAAVGAAKRAGIEGVEGKVAPRRPYVGPEEEGVKEGIRRGMAEMEGVEAGLMGDE